MTFKCGSQIARWHGMSNGELWRLKKEKIFIYYWIIENERSCMWKFNRNYSILRGIGYRRLKKMNFLRQAISATGLFTSQGTFIKMQTSFGIMPELRLFLCEMYSDSRHSKNLKKKSSIKFYCYKNPFSWNFTRSNTTQSFTSVTHKITSDILLDPLIENDGSTAQTCTLCLCL